MLLGLFDEFHLQHILKHSLSLRECLRQAINTGLFGILSVSQAPQNLFDEAEVETTRSGIVQSYQI